jgi:TRAP-type C4-dicarboxylate transport system permease small subunit
MLVLGLVDAGIDRLVRALVQLLLVVMVTLTLANVGLRWFSYTLIWVEPLVRYLVFASAFLGGIMATGRYQHIAIDGIPRILDRFASERIKALHRAIIALFCVVVCGYLIKSSLSFYETESAFGQIEFLQVHSATLVAILPLGMGLIGFRFFVIALKSLRTLM